ncbi:TPA: hypothetical protein ACOTG0_002717 [Clostridium perfringens]
MNKSKKKPNYILFYMGLFIILGIVYNQLSLGLLLGFTIGLALDVIKTKN